MSGYCTDSREHAAITPMFLGVKAVIVKSIARIHKNNLINHGVLPMIFENPSDYEKLSLGDEPEILNLIEQLKSKCATLNNKTTGKNFSVLMELSDSEADILLSGGQLAYIKNNIPINIEE